MKRGGEQKVKEKNFTRLLLAIGIVCLAIITITDIITTKIFSNLAVELLPCLLCQKDRESNYILAKPTSIEVCDMVSNVSDMANTKLCGNFPEQKKDACFGLVGAVQNRSKDCFYIILGRNKTSVNPEDIKRYCEILNSSYSFD